MTPNEAYENFIIKVNENAQTDNISVDRGRFTRLFNEGSIKFVEWILEKKNEDDIRYINHLLTTKVESEFEQKDNYQLFKLPSDFFDLGNISGKGSTDCCKKVDFDIFEVKVDNQGVIINDELNKPNGEYREAPYYLEGKKIKVLTDNFIIDNVSISYYKYPQYIELIDEADPESKFKNEDTHMEFDDKALNRIISIASSDNSLNTGNPKAQLEKQRVVSKF